MNALSGSFRKLKGSVLAARFKFSLLVPQPRGVSLLLWHEFDRWCYHKPIYATGLEGETGLPSDERKGRPFYGTDLRLTLMG